MSAPDAFCTAGLLSTVQELNTSHEEHIRKQRDAIDFFCRDYDDIGLFRKDLPEEHAADHAAVTATTTSTHNPAVTATTATSTRGAGRSSSSSSALAPAAKSNTRGSGKQTRKLLF